MEEAARLQFWIVDCITREFQGHELLSRGDLGVVLGANQPLTTQKAELVIARSLRGSVNRSLVNQHLITGCKHAVKSEAYGAASRSPHKHTVLRTENSCNYKLRLLCGQRLICPQNHT